MADAGLIEEVFSEGGIPRAPAVQPNGASNCSCGKSITYELNSLGYRSPDFTAQAEFKIAVFGCEDVFGENLCSDELFHARAGNTLSQIKGKRTVAFNLGIPGAANGTIMRLVSMAVPLLEPDLVLINFTRASRREYVGADGKLFLFDPERPPGNMIEKELKKHLMTLSNPYADVVNFYRNFWTISRILSKRRWFWSVKEKWVVDELGARLPRTGFAGSFGPLETGGDRNSPDRGDHGQLAERLVRLIG